MRFPCQGLCPLVFGTEEEHFDLYEPVSPSESSCYMSQGLVLCLLEDPATTTTTTTTTATPPCTHHSHSNGYPFSGVQIIGPRPVYNNYNTANGPQVIEGDQNNSKLKSKTGDPSKDTAETEKFASGSDRTAARSGKTLGGYGAWIPFPKY